MESMEYAGLDFGTSNCSLAIWLNDQPRLIPLENGSTRLPSAMYTPKQQIEIGNVDEAALARRTAELAAAQTREVSEAAAKGRRISQRSQADLENQARGLLRREKLEEARRQLDSQSLQSALTADSNTTGAAESDETVFGEAAINRHIEEPMDGYFIKSPKSFLGAKLESRQLKTFEEIVLRMLAHIRTASHSQLETSLTSIVIGRPVRFHGSSGANGEQQALSLMERAALAAGFTDVEFLMEPVAASLDFERHLDRDANVLVLDIGGGTTDCSMVRLGPSYRKVQDRAASILGYAGDRIGGLDLDAALSLEKLMPLFGKGGQSKNGLPLPKTLFWNAVTVNDVNAQKEFGSRQQTASIERHIRNSIDSTGLERLLKLQTGKLAFSLSRSAEMAKIALSDASHTRLSLDFVENGLIAQLDRKDLAEAAARHFEAFIRLMQETEQDAGVKPDIIYVTGGTARSPVVEEWIRSRYSDTELVIGDLFGSVTSGLATWAHRIFGAQTTGP